MTCCINTVNQLFVVLLYWNLCLCVSPFSQVKVCNPVDKTCHTLAGTGEPGLINGELSLAQFSEPGGVCVCDEGKTLFISDTNNSCIRKIDLQSKVVSKVSLS